MAVHDPHQQQAWFDASAATSIRGIPIHKVSVVDEGYRLVNTPTVIDLPNL
jgi:hypothetical protein